MQQSPRIIVAFALLACFANVFASEEEDVSALFKRYLKAVAAKDGKTAVDCVDAKSVEWYQEAVNDAMKAEKAAILKMPASRHATVLKLRIEFNKEQLSKMSGRETIDIAVAKGWTGIDDENQMSLAKVKVNGENAEGFIAGMPDAPLLYFKKESGKWVLELWRMMTLGDAFFADAAKQAGMTEEELILKSLQTDTKAKVDQSIYEPPK